MGASHKKQALRTGEPLNQPCVQVWALHFEGEVGCSARVWEGAKGTSRDLRNLIYEKKLKEFHLFSLEMTFSLLRHKSCYIKIDGHRFFFFVLPMGSSSSSQLTWRKEI